MNRHTPVLALALVLFGSGILLGLAQIAGIWRDIGPVPVALAAMGWVTMMLWFRLIKRERKRFFENQAHERAELNGLLTERHYPVRGIDEPPEDREP